MAYIIGQNQMSILSKYVTNLFSFSDLIPSCVSVHSFFFSCCKYCNAQEALIVDGPHQHLMLRGL